MKIKDGDRIVFAGDSTTDADKRVTLDGLGNGYVRLIHDALFAFCPKENFSIVNAGVSGDTSEQLLARWDADVKAQRPDVVFCMIGINDVWRHFDQFDPFYRKISIEEYGCNIEALCKSAESVRDVYFMTPYYMERSHVDEMRVMTEQYAAVMRKIAQSHGFKVIDIQSVFDSYMEGRPGQSIGWDRVHPGPIGSMLIARAVLHELELKL